jgi:hypothetical protein
MTWAARLDNGKGYELNVKPVNILSSTGRVEDDVALMNQVIEQLVKTAAIYKSYCSRKESSKAFCFLSFNSLYIKVVGLCSDTTRAAISQQPKCGALR